MKKLLSILAIINILSLPFADAKTVKGHYKKSTGKYVQPYQRTAPNKTKLDNYSTKGNFNVYTGKKGYKSPLK